MANTFDIDKLIGNTDANVLVTGPGLRFRGIMTNNVTIRAGNSLNTLLESSFTESLSQNINKLLSSAKSLGNLTGSETLQSIKLPSLTLKSLAQSVQFWVGSETPVFTIEVIKVATKPGQDIRAEVVPLYASVFPERSSQLGSTGSQLFLRPPLGYTPESFGRNAVGTIAVQIGNWARFINHIMKSVNFTFSKEVTRDGFPLYATGTFEFEHFRAITFSEFVQFFNGLRVRNTAAKTETVPPSDQTTAPNPAVN